MQSCRFDGAKSTLPNIIYNVLSLKDVRTCFALCNYTSSNRSLDCLATPNNFICDKIDSLIYNFVSIHLFSKMWSTSLISDFQPIGFQEIFLRYLSVTICIIAIVRMVLIISAISSLWEYLFLHILFTSCDISHSNIASSCRCPPGN